MEEKKQWTERDKRINRILYGIAIGWLVICSCYLSSQWGIVRKSVVPPTQQELLERYIEQSNKQLLNQMDSLFKANPEILEEISGTPIAPANSNQSTGLEKYK